MFWHKKNAFLVIFLFLTTACGNGGPELQVSGGDLMSGPKDHQAGADDFVIDTSNEIPAGQDYQWIDSSQGKVYSESWTPADCTDNSPCPAVVLVPDLLNGIEQFDCCARALAEKLHAVVITFNPPGRGDPGETSDGEEDYGGSNAQDALKDVANIYEKRGEIDGTRFGFVSFGFGLGLASGTLARFQSTALVFVDWLIDVEGSTNRCFITQSPFFVHPDEEGYFINDDGSDVSTTRCDFDLYLRVKKFPEGTSSNGKGIDGTPNSYICHPNAFVLKETGITCGDDQWWAEREAKNHLQKLTVHYLRLQFLHDHKQPTRHLAREALHWVTQADAASYQLNNVNLNNNLKGYSEEDLLTAGAYLTFNAGNGYGTDVFDGDNDFDKLSKAQLYVEIIPQYINRMLTRAAD